MPDEPSLNTTLTFLLSESMGNCLADLYYLQDVFKGASFLSSLLFSVLKLAFSFLFFSISIFQEN
jgi:hypothetical protein